MAREITHMCTGNAAFFALRLWLPGHIMIDSYMKNNEISVKDTFGVCLEKGGILVGISTWKLVSLD